MDSIMSGASVDERAESQATCARAIAFASAEDREAAEGGDTEGRQKEHAQRRGRTHFALREERQPDADQSLAACEEPVEHQIGNGSGMESRWIRMQDNKKKGGVQGDCCSACCDRPLLAG
ncbi:hypothetical protein CMQ_3712 [Grosmannia clavigera kw1407]|uniref:Uncharacterized protein n=1 Tax=Grosmannia clavigera (strain kw1407 / UAMH 11150) TaxID=655863 RepID=F0XA42_GROCL|nr:uncharacterized protein CMQ_3712 [Grosmannia clavigera kw1407]EFX05643.1 hypothetical protein CMQ_3712 [Grosmannia clavigera kw1407]